MKKAARIERFGGRDIIEIVDIEKPWPAEGQVLVEVHSSSINPADIKVLKGIMVKSPPITFPMTLGMDIAGVIAEVGPGVTGLRTGEKVYGQSRAWSDGTGAYAEYAVATVGSIAKMPKNISFPEAGVLPLTGTSAVIAIKDNIKLKKGQQILILGGAGGIGSIAIQLAKHIGAYIATTGTGDEIEFERSLGADKIIDYKTQEFDKELSDFDAVFDTVGGEFTALSFKVLKKGGILVSMVQKPEEGFMKKYGINAVMQYTHVTAENLDRLTKFLEDGAIKIHIDKFYTLDKIREAFEAKESGTILGKISVIIR